MRGSSVKLCRGGGYEVSHSRELPNPHVRRCADRPQRDLRALRSGASHRDARRGRNGHLRRPLAGRPRRLRQLRMAVAVRVRGSGQPSLLGLRATCPGFLRALRPAWPLTFRLPEGAGLRSPTWRRCAAGAAHEPAPGGPPRHGRRPTPHVSTAPRPPGCPSLTCADMFDAPAGSRTRSTNAAAAHPAHAIYQSILTTDTPLVTTDTLLLALNWLRMGRLVESSPAPSGWSRVAGARPRSPRPVRPATSGHRSPGSSPASSWTACAVTSEGAISERPERPTAWASCRACSTGAPGCGRSPERRIRRPAVAVGSEDRRVLGGLAQGRTSSSRSIVSSSESSLVSEFRQVYVSTSRSCVNSAFARLCSVDGHALDGSLGHGGCCCLVLSRQRLAVRRRLTRKGGVMAGDRGEPAGAAAARRRTGRAAVAQRAVLRAGHAVDRITARCTGRAGGAPRSSTGSAGGTTRWCAPPTA